MESFSSIWNMVIEELKKEYSQTQIDLWFEDMQLISLSDSRAVLFNKSEFKRDILKSRYKETVSRCFERVLGFPVEVVFTTADKSTEPTPPPEGVDPLRETEVFPGKVTVEGYSLNRSEGTDQFANGNAAQYTFDNFIVGSSNRFAHAACMAVASNPATDYNPLFIYGSSGLGKTHLLYAITNEITHRNPQAKIIYVKGEDFTNQLIESLRLKCTKQFRDKYRRADVLLIDDIQFIAGKEGIQEEFFHTFNALYEDHKQIILTSDRPPREIRLLEDRLRTRFEWGVIADIQVPDFELRIAIMKSKAEALHIDIPNNVLEYLAENLRNNVRQLEGAIKKLGAQSFLTGVPITTDLAISCVADMLTGAEPISVTVDRIFDKVSKKYGITSEEIKGRKRTKEIARARHICIYLIRKLTDMSLPAIGNILSRDHSTVMSSLDVVENQIKNDSLFDIEVGELEREIKNNI